MIYFPLEAIIISNSIVFVAFVFIAFMILYLGRKTDPKKKIKLAWVDLSLGVIMAGITFPIQIGVALGTFTEEIGFVTSCILMLTGASLAFTSFLIVYLERIDEINFLKKRQKEITMVMKKLRHRYFRKEISEEQLRKMYADFIKELTEIEVKLKEMGQKGLKKLK